MFLSVVLCLYARE